MDSGKSVYERTEANTLNSAFNDNTEMGNTIDFRSWSLNFGLNICFNPLLHDSAILSLVER
jgi:hypothetical protein